MKEDCTDIQELLSGFLDGELDEAQQSRVDSHLSECPACRDELEKMKLLVAVTSSIRIEDPPEEVWDTFLDNVYNNLERRTGWLIAIAGAIANEGAVNEGECSAELVIDPPA